MHSLHKVSYQNKWFDSSRLLIWVGSNTTKSGENQNCKGSTLYRQGGDPHQEVLLLHSCDWPQAWWPCQSSWPGPVNQGRSELHLSNATLPLGLSGLIIMPPATMVQDIPACHAHYKTTPSFLYFKLLVSLTLKITLPDLPFFSPTQVRQTHTHSAGALILTKEQLGNRVINPRVHQRNHYLPTAMYGRPKGVLIGLCPTSPHPLTAKGGPNQSLSNRINPQPTTPHILFLKEKQISAAGGNERQLWGPLFALNLCQCR